MRIVNLIHIGDQVLSLDDMDPMKKAEIMWLMNRKEKNRLKRGNIVSSQFWARTGT